MLASQYLAAAPPTLDLLELASDSTQSSALKQKQEATRVEANLDSQSKRSVAPTIKWGGLVELEASVASIDDDPISDIALSTLELGAEVDLNSSIRASVLMLYEEDATPLEIDVAKLELDTPVDGLSIAVGQDYLPFGIYESALISDPLTLELGETRETSIQIQFAQDWFTSTLYTFNGDQDRNDEDRVQTAGLRLHAHTDQYSLSLDYTSNLTDSDALQSSDFLVDGQTDTIDGASLAFAWYLDAITLSAEHISALNDLPGDGALARPSASHLELAAKQASWVYAVAFEQTAEAELLSLPEDRYRAGLSKILFNGVQLGAELSYAKNSTVIAATEPENSTDLLVQLAAQF